jgi:hypothetical protein
VKINWLKRHGHYARYLKRQQQACLFDPLDPKLRVSKVAVFCFSWGICNDFYGVKSAAGG